MRPLLLALAFALLSGSALAQTAPSNYLAPIDQILRTDWPGNRRVNIVCHGHSVPAGYFKTPEVRSEEAYPHQLAAALAQRYPHAVLNVIVTAIGGEDSEKGASRFEAEVLCHRPDVILIDYALNDRRIGLVRARVAWTAMIEAAQARGIKVLLLTPTPDEKAKLNTPEDPLNQHAEQIRELAKEYQVGLADSLAAFEGAIKEGVPLASLMSQSNHPNKAGHALVAQALMEWFDGPK